MNPYIQNNFNSSFRSVDNVISLSISPFIDYLYFIYQNELEVKNTSEAQKSVSYLDL